MEPTTIAALGALLISSIGMIFQGWKFIQEIRERASRSKDDATKAGAERDSIVVKTSEGMILVMQGMLDVARMSEAELRVRIKEVEKENLENEKRIRDLEEKNRVYEEALHREREEYAKSQELFEERMRLVVEQYEQQISALHQRTTALEIKTNGNRDGKETDPR